MARGVFLHRADSIYDDRPEERYQFPRQYFGRASQFVGDWIIYYEPRRGPTARGYYAIARVERIVPDPTAPDMYLALIEPGSCFAGTLAELAFASDRSYMALGRFDGDNRPEATLTLAPVNFGRYPMANGLSRLATRFLGTPEALETARARIAEPLDAATADALGLVTFAFDDIDWEDEIRIFREERASFSPDALTGLEANLRFAGPETMETRIFGRLTAWQNWIFQRPNAAGPEGALKRYGTGQRPGFDSKRI